MLKETSGSSSTHRSGSALHLHRRKVSCKTGLEGVNLLLKHVSQLQFSTKGPAPRVTYGCPRICEARGVWLASLSANLYLCHVRMIELSK